MSRMNRDKSRSFFGGRGFYIALVLCLAAIGVAGYFVLVQQARVAEGGKNQPVVRQEPVENIQQAQTPQPEPEPVQETLEPEELLPQLAEQTPLGRLGTPEDIAAAVAFLADPAAGFITGQVLTCDGGFIL